MELFGKDVPDDLNEWSRQTFEDITNMFAKATSREPIQEQKTPVNDKPDRNTVIQKDEITNLKIELGEIETVDDFLKRM